MGGLNPADVDELIADARLSGVEVYTDDGAKLKFRTHGPRTPVQAACAEALAAAKDAVLARLRLQAAASRPVDPDAGNGRVGDGAGPGDAAPPGGWPEGWPFGANYRPTPPPGPPPAPAYDGGVAWSAGLGAPRARRKERGA